VADIRNVTFIAVAYAIALQPVHYSSFFLFCHFCC